MNEKAIAEIIGMILASGMVGGLSDEIKKPDYEKFKAEAMAKREDAKKAAKAFEADYVKRNADNAKALYDAYKEAGFSEVQSFELLKETYILR